MSPTHARDTPEGRAYNDLRNRAKHDGRDVAEYLTLYALEGFLDRLAHSRYASDLVLKGGTLMAAFASRRPTRDIDLRASGFSNDAVDAIRVVTAIALLPTEDGLLYDVSGIRGQMIREGADYEGIRVSLTAHLASAVIPFHIDMNFNDPIWPAPTMMELPRLLGGTVSLLAYPAPMVLAEKVMTAIERGSANTRWRDFADVAAIVATVQVRADDLAAAVNVVGAYRKIAPSLLSEALADMALTAQPKWSAWRHKQRLTGTIPEQFQEVLDTCVSFIDPVLARKVDGMRWNPKSRIWH